MKRFALMAALGAIICGSMIAGCGGGEDDTAATTTTMPPGAAGAPGANAMPGAAGNAAMPGAAGNAAAVPAPVTN